MDKISSEDFDKNSAGINIEGYSETGFWEKTLKYAKVIGLESMRKVLQLYYALESEFCTAKHKAIIYGALAYLVSPFDIIPDLTPFLGYTDDMAIIASALYAVAVLIDDEVIAKTETKLKSFFG
ncbi:YkvA family protein [Marinomonas sp. IMCC 4694]|uniref:YkvA family protein n=1 Tax=Marinomonas sp. IMCC 4694 TaxID=2605432 RepID=UPI0011E86ACD|nr:DUF1232 domain-containing protein [Marinomonas sp. IMCC 4694]TYL47312.1 DUF1232 domain-containing protein [Marinomonas sp. IMCC 4694]